MVETNTFASGDEAGDAAGMKLGEFLSRDVPILLLISGGSSMEVLKRVDLELLGEQLTVGLLDERYVKSDGSNYAEFLKTEFYEGLSERGAYVLDSSLSERERRIGPLLGVIELARRMEKGVKEWSGKFSNGIVVITQGMGKDGHTAGIMPYPERRLYFERLFESDSWFVGYDNEGRSEYRYRSTVTNYFLKEHVDASVFYAVGEEKEPALRGALSEGDINELPARVIGEMREVYVYTDISLNES